MSKLRVLVVADCEALRRSLVLLLTGSSDVAGAVPSHHLPDAVQKVDPEVVVWSLRPPLVSHDPDALYSSAGGQKPFVLVTRLSLDVNEWLDYGDVCVVNEEDLQEELSAAVEAAAAGKIYFSRRAVRFHG